MDPLLCCLGQNRLNKPISTDWVKISVIAQIGWLNGAQMEIAVQ